MGRLALDTSSQDVRVVPLLGVLVDACLAESGILNQAESLRTRLRDDTRAAHERVDAAYRSCDIAGPHGLGLFLSDHLRAFSALSLTEGAGYAQAQALHAEYRHALEADLAALGLPLPAAREQLRVTAVPALYIFLGSRRGAQMMHRHWSASARGEARSAGRFLSLDPRNADWRRLCLGLSARPAQGPEADHMVAEVNAIFGLFDPRSAFVPKGRHD